MALAVLASTAAAGSEWRDYVNVRFQYAFCYRTDLFSPQREADNSDGRAFKGASGVSLIVYGRNAMPGDSVAATARSFAASNGGETTLLRVKADCFVVSGVQAATIYYVRGLYRDEQYKIVKIAYPAAQAGAYDALVEKLAACFHNTTP